MPIFWCPRCLFCIHFFCNSLIKIEIGVPREYNKIYACLLVLPFLPTFTWFLSYVLCSCNPKYCISNSHVFLGRVTLEAHCWICLTLRLVNCRIWEGSCLKSTVQPLNSKTMHYVAYISIFSSISCGEDRQLIKVFFYKKLQHFHWKKKKSSTNVAHNYRDALR